MIFCVEDDSGIRELILYTLSASGFETKGFSKADDFWKELKSTKPELVLLDIMLPGEDGISILRKLRSDSSTCDIPVIIASAKGTEYDKVTGLDLGADDYLAKPFGMMEMMCPGEQYLEVLSCRQFSDKWHVFEINKNMEN